MNLHSRKKFFLERGLMYAKQTCIWIASLRSQISDSSHLYPFYLYLNWRRITEREYYMLCLALGYLKGVPPVNMTEEEKYILNELIEQFDKNHKRFRQTKFARIFYSFYVNPGQAFRFKNELFPPVRELKGNQLKSLELRINEIFTLRHQTPRRVRRSERIRGYRDHGSLPADPGRKACLDEYIKSYLPVEEYIPLIKRTSTDPVRALRRLNLFKE